MNRPHSSIESISLVKRGDHSAFRELYDTWYTYVVHRLSTFIREEELIQEVLQETFVQLWLQRSQLDEGKDIGAFIFTVSKRKAIDILRRQVKLALATDELGYAQQQTDSAEELLIQKEERERLQRLLALLPEQQRQVVELTKLNELSYEEVASKLNISKHTVKNHLVRAMKVLRYKVSIFFIFFLF